MLPVPDADPANYHCGAEQLFLPEMPGGTAAPEETGAFVRWSDWGDFGLAAPTPIFVSVDSAGG